MTASFALVIVLTRLRRDVSMLPATCVSQAVVALVLAAVRLARLGDARGLGPLLRARHLPGRRGLALLTIAARLLPAAEVAVLSLLEIVLGPIWVWLAYSERPNTATFVGGPSSRRPSSCRRPEVALRPGPSARHDLRPRPAEAPRP